ncbi:MAG: DUF91 domain-containing protein [Acidimicrobiaceae bacterium]|nr:DUF91 domain-containing protein [Acidimicrobiaceae bacterium]MYE97482.1 DUF91 domain-containing protein [Acidimicrobiaceae bacterium]MYI53917.1 DUF91 domain-containing protein [Acidimicrobiaceae bacterium]
MAVEMAIWRVEGDKAAPLTLSPMDSERRLEDMVAEDPAALTGTDLLIIGRQVKTDFGGVVDLLGLDDEGRVHVLELKRDKTPREVVAQTLDYGSWIKALDLGRLDQIYQIYHGDEADLKAAFASRFAPIPDEDVNSDQRFTIIASELDPASARIVEFYGVPINAVFFRHYRDDDRDYLARTWLVDPQQVEAESRRASRTKRRPWNGTDFYIALGRAGMMYRWELASKYGLLSAGGRSRLRNLKPGTRVFAYMPGSGYVGIGRVTGQMIPARVAEVEIDGERQPLLDQPHPDEEWAERAESTDPDVIEMVVPVEWLAPESIREPDQAFREKGLFASQLTVCKLRDEHTIKAVESAFALASQDADL